MHIPKDLEAEWKHLVKTKFKGNEQSAIREAVQNMIDEERKRVPKGKQFDTALDKVKDRQERSEEILADGLSDALTRMKERKKRGLPI